LIRYHVEHGINTRPFHDRSRSQEGAELIRMNLNAKSIFKQRRNCIRKGKYEQRGQLTKYLNAKSIFKQRRMTSELTKS
jgi:hypothetical protein